MQIIVKLTTACNFACSYCSEGNQPIRELDPRLFYKLVDGLPRLLEHCCEKNVEFLWHGGEPLLYGCEKLSQLMDYAQNKLIGYNIRFLMQTNGYLLDEEWLSCLQEYGIAPGISFDGLPEMHDEHRRTKDGKPTAVKVLNNLHMLREAGFQISTLMVLDTSEHVDSQALLAFIKKHGLHPKIHPVIPCGRAAGEKDTKKIYANYVQMLKEIYEQCVKKGDDLDIEPLDSLLTAILTNGTLSECSFNGSCGKKFLCLYPDGEVGFCGRDNASRCLAYGNIQEHEILQLYESPNAQAIRSRNTYLRDNECHDCQYWSLCQGGCSYEAMNYYGRLENSYPYCAGRKQLIKYLRTDGLELLKQRLLVEKRECKAAIEAEKDLLEETKLYAE